MIFNFTYTLTAMKKSKLSTYHLSNRRVGVYSTQSAPRIAGYIMKNFNSAFPWRPQVSQANIKEIVIYKNAKFQNLL